MKELAEIHLGHLQRELTQQEFQEAKERERQRKIAMIKEEAEKRRNGNEK